MHIELWLVDLMFVLSVFGLIYINILFYKLGRLSGVAIIKLYFKHVKHIEPARENPETTNCLYCELGEPIIYDQDHDCCMTCKSKWKVE